jgi:hypothetical protein
VNDISPGVVDLGKVANFRQLHGQLKIEMLATDIGQGIWSGGGAQ